MADYSRQDDFEGETYTFLVIRIKTKLILLVGAEADKEDIHHLEFSLMNNAKSLHFRASALSDKEIELVKLVISSSLYPQLAIGVHL